MDRKKDIRETFELIVNFWPDFQISFEDLTQPSSNFVVRFFVNFLNEFDSNLSFVLNEEIMNDEIESAQLSEEMIVFRRVNEILTKLNYNSLTLKDIFNPTVKRIYLAIKYSIHFLIYVNNHLDDFTVCSDFSKMIAHLEELETLQQQYLQEVGENATSYARLLDSTKELTAKLETVKETHEIMLKERSEKEKILLDLDEQTKKIQGDNDILDNKFQSLEVELGELEKHIVTEEDFENLKKSMNYWKLELDQVSEEIASVNTDRDKEEALEKLLENNLKLLDTLNLEYISTHVITLKNIDEQFNIKEKLVKEQKDEYVVLNQEKCKLLKKIEEMEQINDQCDKLLVETQSRFMLDSEKRKKLYDREIVNFRDDFEEYQKLKTSYCEKEEEIVQIENRLNELKLTTMREYKRILDANAFTTNKFYKVLSEFKDKCYN